MKKTIEYDEETLCLPSCLQITSEFRETYTALIKDGKVVALVKKSPKN